MPRLDAVAGRIVVVAASIILLAGCFTSTTDYRTEAETFIVEDDTIATELDVAMTSATCEEPADQNVGTIFTCSAIDADGDTWGFNVVITESNRIQVAVSTFPQP